ncbi:hypothetical protein HN51_013534 [Arachis hypogaea]|uniref:PB1 domain-containing protein n=1 Tax=Arachis hypogaea TaxID=3818 RepID=A0A445DPT0_ARAHY|nr:uncharacterized protein LOC112791745 [Arachis hypogaea]XP_057745980.1 protein PAL OF QUIRKY-like [Arachis stenosperma]QHO59268.1 uncharacterized protein DS421_3g97750 [Arachis hypogaea]RYR65184.1 hypothetical protein Ahy_A03g011158 isoform A [Arachis hypogaea]RYR65185.1 hypothetical protein Ahy_A03g011158 isoform B [Arachis hypogaea]RYR65186.1 hypothetical protein Ahy_A03g011158 isoform C [Arachis hypogaea]
MGGDNLKFLCSYDGKILPRYPDGKLRYLGGHTRLLSLPRSTAFSELLVKLGDLCGSPVTHLRCQLPTEDLDALVSITSDEDLANLLEEYDRVSSSKIRLFLSYSSTAKTTPSSSSSSSSSSSTSSFRAQMCTGTKKSAVTARNSAFPCYGYRVPGNAGGVVYLVNNCNHWH